MRNLSNFFLVAGVSVFCLGAAIAFRNLKFYRDSKVTTGRVVDYERHASRSAMHHPVVEYEASKNEKTIFKSAVASNVKRYAIGAQVPVRFTPADPRNAEINKGWIVWFDVPLCFVFAFVLLWLGAR